MNYALAYEYHKKTTVQMNKSHDLCKSKCKKIGLSESLLKSPNFFGGLVVNN